MENLQATTAYAPPSESVLQSKSTRSRKPPELSTTERGHHMDGWPLYAGQLFASRYFSESKSVRTLQKSFGWDYKPRSPVCICKEKDHIRTLKILQSMLEFVGLWKHQNNPACTKKKKCQESSECWSWTLYEKRRRRRVQQMSYSILWICFKWVST